jgi:hypothetical protein
MRVTDGSFKRFYAGIALFGAAFGEQGKERSNLAFAEMLKVLLESQTCIPVIPTFIVSPRCIRRFFQRETFTPS